MFLVYIMQCCRSNQDIYDYEIDSLNEQYCWRWFEGWEKKMEFFQAIVVLVLLYGGTTWTLTKYLENKCRWELNKDAVINKSWKQYTKKTVVQVLTSHLTNHPSKVNTTGHNHKQWTATREHTSVSWLGKTYIH